MKRKLLPMMIAGLAAAQAQAGTVTSSGDDVIIATKGGFSIQTADKRNSFNIGGRLQWDYDNTDSDVDGKDVNDMEVRRARIFLKGTVEKDWGYKAQFNIDEEGSSDAGTVEDLYIRYMGFGKLANITIGKQKEPFGLEQQISSKDIAILERSAMTEYHAFGRNTGVQLHGKGSNWTYGIGAFENGDGKEAAGDTAITGRFTFAPVKENGEVLHLGAGFSERSGSDANEVESAYNLELAGVMGSLHGQAEFFETDINGVGSMDGYYVQAGWIITGESRPYKDGKFKIVKPAEKSGAWEAVIRYEDGHGKFSDVGLGSVEGEQLALGINYYPNSAVRLGASWMTGEEDASGLEGDEIRIRFQYVYK
jgi:phosphate-selective porin OprO/OprP